MEGQLDLIFFYYGNYCRLYAFDRKAEPGPQLFLSAVLDKFIRHAYPFHGDRDALLLEQLEDRAAEPALQRVLFNRDDRASRGSCLADAFSVQRLCETRVNNACPYSRLLKPLCRLHGRLDHRAYGDYRRVLALFQHLCLAKWYQPHWPGVVYAQARAPRVSERGRPSILDG